MKRLFIFILWVVACFSSCEDIYHPDIDGMENLLVIEARFVYGQSNNVVKIFRTKGFNEITPSYPPVTGATVSLMDDKGVTTLLTETENGTYLLIRSLLSSRKYKIRIIAEGEEYTSPFQAIPEVPSIDSVYLTPSEQLFVGSTDEAAGGLKKIQGAQVFIDIDAKTDVKHYRFTGRKICQYTYNRIPAHGPPVEIPIYGWVSLGPGGSFNLAAPGEYSVSDDIRKHPLVFLERSLNIYIPDTVTSFVGWIYICQQYALAEQTYHFYSDLDKQLTAGGKLFDPLYTQARGNLSCMTDPGKLVLGNFEIVTVKEHRFFVQPVGKDNYYINRIPYFWNIPQEGKIEYLPPVWWEYINKKYPSGKP